MRRSVLVLIIAVLAVVIADTAQAWEFSMTGEYELRYRYISRTGRYDLFGDAQAAQSNIGSGTSIGLAGPNSLSLRLEGFSSKGSDASFGEHRFWLYPRVDVNPAITLRAIITFGANPNANYDTPGIGETWLTNPHYNGWMMLDSRDFRAGTGISLPVLTALWARARLPIGTLVFGQRPAAFGMGWVIHEEDSYARSISLIVPYGPLTFVFSQYLHDSYEDTDPNDSRNAARTVRTMASAVDQNENMVLNQSTAVIYQTANFDTGIMLSWLKSGPLHNLGQPGGTFQDDRSGNWFSVLFLDSAHANDPNMPLYGEGFFLLGITYLKYTDGRFFFNAEYDWEIINFTRNGGRPLSGFSQAWATEFGVAAGPAKVTFAHFYRSGHDRRGGYFNTTTATGGFVAPGPAGVTVFTADRYDLFIAPWGASYTPMKPYTFLMGLYGTGNNAYSATVPPTGTGGCLYLDFAGYAARVDYAVAANLNIFASFLYATRASDTGTPQGFFNGVRGPLFENPFYPFTLGVTPNVPSANTDLGYEITAGVVWKLLEGLTFKYRGAYWQPGSWFPFAFADMTLSNPAQGVTGTVNSTRTINAILGHELNLLIEF